jgi:flagellin
LSVQAANGSNSNDDRASLQLEVTQLQTELDRIANTTTFGGQSLLDGSFGSQSFQVGSESGQTISVEIEDVSAASLEGTVHRESLEGTSRNVVDTNATLANIAGDVTLNTADGATVVATNGLGAADAAAAINNANTGVNAMAVAEFQLSSLTATGIAAGAALSIGDVDISLNATDTYASIAEKINDAGFTAVNNGTTIDVTATGVDGVVLNTGGGGSLSIAAGDANANTFGTPGTVTTGSASIDARVDLSSDTTFSASGNAADLTGGSAIAAATVENIGQVDISSQQGAMDALSIIDGALETIDDQRANLGAVQNRFESTISNLTNISENVSAAGCRIRDVYFDLVSAIFSL